MRKKTYRIIIAMAALVFICMAGSSYAMSGREIMMKYTEQFGMVDETNDAAMVLISKTGKERSRSLTIMTKKYPDALHKILIRFTAPQTIYGAGLLIVEQKNRSDDEWLYLPAMKKVKKISTAERSHSFMGSEFSYEDLHREVLDDHNYKLKGSEVLDGQDCFIIESTPASPRKVAETGYSKRLLWIRKDIFFKIKVQYYDKKGKLLKTETDEHITQVKPGVYRMGKIIMVNDGTGNRTVLTSKSRSFDTGIPSSRFTTTYLEQGV